MNRNLKTLLELALVGGTLSLVACDEDTTDTDGVCDTEMMDEDPDCEEGCPEEGCPEEGCPEEGCPEEGCPA